MGGSLSSFTSTSPYLVALILKKNSVSLATIYILMKISRVYIRKEFLIGLIVFKYFFNMAKTA